MYIIVGVSSSLFFFNEVWQYEAYLCINIQSLSFMWNILPINGIGAAVVDYWSSSLALRESS